MAPRVGLEPTTTRLTAECSTDWANEAWYVDWPHLRGLTFLIKLVPTIIKSLPASSFFYTGSKDNYKPYGRQSRSRTYDVSNVSDLQSDAIANYAYLPI